MADETARERYRSRTTRPGNKPTSTHIRFKFETVLPSPYTSTPKLLDYDCRGILYPTGMTSTGRRRVITTVVSCVDNKKDKDGNDLGLTASEIRTILEEADDATWPVTIYDVWGNTKYVKFLPMAGSVISQEKDRNIEIHYTLMMEEVRLS